MKWIFLTLTLLFSMSLAYANSDPLPSWNEGAIKKNIIHFVASITNPASIHYVTPEDRIATIDNDGTLWVEQPLYTQFIFALDRIKQLANHYPAWRTQEPFKFVLNNQFEKLTPPGIEKILAVTQTGMSVEYFQMIAQKWLATAKDRRFKRHYTELVYQPMLEMIRYLQDNQFKVYIVSGGGQDFIRAFAEHTYHIPTDRVIGATGKTHYIYQNDRPQLIKLPELLFNNNYAGKAQSIHLFIGKKPLIAFGNSDGDKQMLEWTQSGKGKRLMLLIHHDDAQREYAYDTQSKVGTFSKALMDEANKNGWQVISMKNDWKSIFPFQHTSTSIKETIHSEI